MSKQIESNPSRISFDPKGVDVEALDELADDREMSRAELIREELAELIDRETDDDHDYGEIHKPENEELREAFEALLELSNHPLGPRPISVAEAEDGLYSQSCRKAAVKRRLLKPLAELGFITVRSARIVVHRRTVEQIEIAEEETDAEFDELETADRPESPTMGKKLDPIYQELLKYQRAGLNPPVKYIGWVSAQTVWNDEGGVSA